MVLSTLKDGKKRKHTLPVLPLISKLIFHFFSAHMCLSMCIKIFFLDRGREFDNLMCLLEYPSFFFFFLGRDEFASVVFPFHRLHPSVKLKLLRIYFYEFSCVFEIVRVAN